MSVQTVTSVADVAVRLACLCEIAPVPIIPTRMKSKYISQCMYANERESDDLIGLIPYIRVHSQLKSYSP